jgi:uncharacterized protein (TIGR02001 family)
MQNIRIPLAVSVLCVGLFAPRPGLAEEAAAAPTAHTFSGNAGLFSDYRFRAISQTYNEPAIQGGFDYAHSSGLYAGTWASNVSGNLYVNGASMEWDFYGGYKFELVEDLLIDLGIYEYYYPDAHYNDPKKTDYDNTELYIGASWQWLSVKYWHAVTDYFGVNEHTYGGYAPVVDNHGGTDPTQALPSDRGDSKGSNYFEVNASFAVADKTTLGLHAGHLNVENYGELDYTDYKISLARDFGWATLAAAAIASDASAKWYRYCESNAAHCKDPTGSTLVVSVSRAL